MLSSPAVRTSRYRPSGVIDSSSGLLVEPGLAAAAAARCSRPPCPTRKVEMVPLPASAVNAMRPLMATQHAAASVEDTGPERRRRAPVWLIRYDDAALKGVWWAS